MNVASLELSKELYELSGWTLDDGSIWDMPHYEDKRGDVIAPQYDLGYLLRRLPWQLELIMVSDGSWLAHHTASGARHFNEEANTPEDAACKLCISLFNQGVLPTSKEGGEK
jgi:hypothetical protein